MRVKSLYIVALFQIVALCGLAQAIDIFENDGDGVTMAVDRDVAPRKSMEELEQENQEQINEKWRLYLTEKNNEVEQLFNEVQTMDSTAVTKEIIGDYLILMDNLKDAVNFKLSNNDLWKDDDQLDKMRTSFFATQSRAVLKLQQLDAKIGQKKEKTSPLLIIGICLLSIMAVVPIFTQIKSSVVVKKAKKLQEKLTKAQQEEAERQRLLADAKNEITLK